MSYLLPHLHSGWAVDQAILSEQDRIVIIRFGRDWTPECMQMDEILARIAEKVKNMAVIYLVRCCSLFPFFGFFIANSCFKSSPQAVSAPEIKYFASFFDRNRLTFFVRFFLDSGGH
jgi:hypothetical protein